MASLQDILGPIIKKIEELPEDAYGKDILTFIESNDRYEMLLQKLNNKLHSGVLSNQELSQDAFNKLCYELSNELCDIYFEKKNTDAIYPITSYSRANRACIVLAEALAQLTKTHTFAKLMPQVEAAVPMLTRRNLSEFKLHEIMLADDGTVIEVEKCLLQALQNKTLQLYHTQNTLRKLNTNERKRIITHSREAINFYNALIKYVIDGKDEYQQPLEQFIKAIRSDNYQVLSTYGSEGEKRLIFSILKNVKNKHQFIDLVSGRVHSKQWKMFLKKIPTSLLMQIMLEGEPLINVLQSRSSYTGDETRDRAMLYCFAEIYLRQQQGEDNPQFLEGWLPNYINQYLGNYSTQCKQEACKLLQVFLASHEELHTFESVLKRMAIKDEHFEALFSILTNLGLFTEQIRMITNPDYFRPQVSVWQKMSSYRP